MTEQETRRLALTLSLASRRDIVGAAGLVLVRLSSEAHQHVPPLSVCWRRAVARQPAAPLQNAIDRGHENGTHAANIGEAFSRYQWSQRNGVLIGSLQVGWVADRTSRRGRLSGTVPQRSHYSVTGLSLGRLPRRPFSLHPPRLFSAGTG